MTVSVRDARPDELDAIADVMVAAYEEYIPRNATGDLHAYREEIRDVESRLAHATLIVAEERARLLGAVTYYPDGSREGHGWPHEWAVFRLLGVHPDGRGRGIGRRLTEECIARARAGGSTAVGLHTTEFMAVARAMYERMGFIRAPQYDFRPIPRIHVMGYRLDLMEQPSAR